MSEIIARILVALVVFICLLAPVAKWQQDKYPKGGP